MNGDAVETYFTVKLVGLAFGCGFAVLLIGGVLVYYAVAVVREKLRTKRRYERMARGEE